MNTSPQRVVVLGLGPIGRAVVHEILRDPGMSLAGAVDPAFAGEKLEGLRVAESLQTLGTQDADVAVHMAGSRFPRVVDQFHELVRRRLHVVSTCEELIAASVRWPKEAARLDEEAKGAGVAILATGVNPGFVMDLLPSGLANACVSIKSIKVTRHVDTSKRRRALQEKTGVGLTRAEFVKRALDGAVGHVGLRDSLLFLLDHVNVHGEAGDESIRPILAAKALGSGESRIEKGRVAGVHQRVIAKDSASRRTVAVYDLKMEFGLEEPFDEIVIDGDPPFRLRIEGGVPGDRATVGMVLSSIRATRDARPGLAR